MSDRQAGLFSLFLLALPLSCVGHGNKDAARKPDSKDAAPSQKTESAAVPAAPADRTLLTREQLQAIRDEVVDFVRALPEDCTPDGMALLRKGGKLFYWGLEQELPRGVQWVLDAWGRPIVILQSEQSREDWCLASPGPDGVWTTEGLPEVVRAAISTEGVELLHDLVERAPHFYGDEEAGHRTVLGDDIVLHVPTGLFFRAYKYPLPNVVDAASSFIALLREKKSLSVVPSPDLVDEVEGLSREERDLASSFIEIHAKSFELTEDTWSHECRRKDGLLPYLYLRSRKLQKEATPFLWIQPTESGWVLDWDVDELFGAIEEGPGRRRDAR